MQFMLKLFLVKLYCIALKVLSTHAFALSLRMLSSQRGVRRMRLRQLLDFLLSELNENYYLTCSWWRMCGWDTYCEMLLRKFEKSQENYCNLFKVIRKSYKKWLKRALKFNLSYFSWIFKFIFAYFWSFYMVKDIIGFLLSNILMIFCNFHVFTTNLNLCHDILVNFSNIPDKLFFKVF